MTEIASQGKPKSLRQQDVDHCARLETVVYRVVEAGASLKISIPFQRPQIRGCEGTVFTRRLQNLAPNLRYPSKSLTIDTMTKPFTLLLAAFSAAAMAAPGIIDQEQAHAVVRRSNPTTCVTGSPASASGYVMNYTAVEDAAAGDRFYDIDPAFNTDHSVGSAMVSCSAPPPPQTATRNTE